MDLFSYILSNLTDPMTLILVIAGSILGMIFGVIPGLSGGLAITLLLPITFSMDSIPGIAFLVSVYIGAVSGGFISATLLGMPGTSATVATSFDAYPLARQGKAVKALSIGILSSFFGSITSICAAVFFSSVISDFAVKIGPWDYTALCVMALTFVITLSDKDKLKGLASAGIGMLLGTVGFAPIDGYQRFTFGIINISDGFPLAAVMMGFFALNRVVVSFGKGKLTLPKVEMKNIKGFDLTFKEIKDNAINIIRSFFIGLGIGFMPGIGGSISSMVAYAKSKDASKKPELYGKGSIEAVFATETANNATIGGVFIPMVSLGIPGNGVTALLLGALTIKGIQPGPLIFVNNSNFVYFMFAAMLLAAIVIFVVQIFGVRWFPYILKVPYHYLYPAIAIMCMVGAYTTTGSPFTIGLLLSFTIFGLLLTIGGFPIPPLVLAYILSPLIENNLRRALQYSDGSMRIFFQHPVSAIIIGITIGSLIIPPIRESLRKRKEGKESVAE